MRRADLLTLRQVARELGTTPAYARKALRKVRWVCPPLGLPPRWDPRVVDLIRAMRGQPHRQLEPAQSDWLTDYTKELHDTAIDARASQPPAAR